MEMPTWLAASCAPITTVLSVPDRVTAAVFERPSNSTVEDWTAIAPAPLTFPLKRRSAPPEILTVPSLSNATAMVLPPAPSTSTVASLTKVSAGRDGLDAMSSTLAVMVPPCALTKVPPTGPMDKVPWALSMPALENPDPAVDGDAPLLGLDRGAAAQRK